MCGKILVHVTHLNPQAALKKNLLFVLRARYLFVRYCTAVIETSHPFRLCNS